jgi:serine protease
MVVTSANQTAQIATGRNQVVAVLDGGFDLAHSALQGRLDLANAYNALDDNANVEDLGDGVDNDSDGLVDRVACHGTFVASLILSAAPDAKILPIRVLDAEGWGSDVSVASGITWAVQHGATVINMSLVLPESTTVVKDAVRAAINAGVVVCSASGTTDDGWQSDSWLARNASIVGATDAQDVVAPWTEITPKVDVLAPGVQIVGALGRKRGEGWANSMGTWEGTSFSTPFLSAGAALLRERNPQWTPAAVRDRLEAASDPAYRQTTSTDPLKGLGRIDLKLALTLATN